MRLPKSTATLETTVKTQKSLWLGNKQQQEGKRKDENISPVTQEHSKSSRCPGEDRKQVGP